MESYKTIVKAINKATDLTDDEKAVLSFIVYTAYGRSSRSLKLDDEEIATATAITTDRIAYITTSLVNKGYLKKSI